MMPVHSRPQVVLLLLLITGVEVVPLRERRLARLPVEKGATCSLFLLAEFRGVHEALRDRGEQGALHLLIGEFSRPR